MTKKRTPEQIVAKLRDANVILNTSKELARVLQSLEISEATYRRWRSQYGGTKSEEAKRLLGRSIDAETGHLLPTPANNPSLQFGTDELVASCLEDDLLCEVAHLYVAVVNVASFMLLT